MSCVEVSEVGVGTAAELWHGVGRFDCSVLAPSIGVKGTSDAATGVDSCECTVSAGGNSIALLGEAEGLSRLTEAEAFSG